MIYLVSCILYLAYFRLCPFMSIDFAELPDLLLAISRLNYFKLIPGGEGGIRTHEGVLSPYTLSRRAP